MGKTVVISDLRLEGSRAHNYILSDGCQRTATGAIEPADHVVTPPNAKLGLLYTGQPLELVFPGSAQHGTLEYTVTLPETMPVDYIPSIPTAVNAGTYHVWHRVVGDRNYKDYGPYAVAVSILNAPVEPQPPSGETLTYNGNDQPLVKAGSVEGGRLLYAIGADGGTAPTEGWSEAVPTGRDAGTYYVWYMAKGDHNHRDTAPVALEVTIARKSLVVTAAAGAKTYGDDDPELALTQEGLVAGDALTVTLKRAAGENVGNYTITYDRYEASDNYEKAFNEAALAIEARSATVTAADQTITGGEAIRDDVSMAILFGLARGDSLSAVTLTAGDGKITPSGAKIVSAAGMDVTGNYTLAYAAGRLTVIPKPTPAPTVKPTKTPRPTKTSRPTKAPRPTAKPTRAPRPTAGPTTAPTAEPGPRPADPDFTLLARMTTSGSNQTALKVAWTRVKHADGYDVYFARCGKRYKLRKTVGASESRAVRFRGLDWHRSYKAYVRAWKVVSGKKVYIGAASPPVHAIAGGYDAECCNAKPVVLNRSRLALKAGKSRTIKAVVKGVKRDRTVLPHVRRVRFYSTNANVATVDKRGRVKAVGKGTCTIYAIAINGVRGSVKVTVK